MSTASAARGGTRLARARRVVVKIGSALLVEKSTSRVNRAWLETLAADVAKLRARGQEVILVSSGAIALGRRQLGLSAGRLRLEESQAAAAVGQIRLAHAWKEVLEQHDFTVAQMLLTLGDTEERRRYLNARSTLETLLKLGAIPVINENDTVATTEIRYGDNDRLAARVAQMVSADCLVLLSDIDGLYTADPGSRCVGALHSRGHAHHAGDRGDGRRLRRHPTSGSGGMTTKVTPARSRSPPAATCASPSATRAAPARAHRIGRALHLVRRRPRRRPCASNGSRGCCSRPARCTWTTARSQHCAEAARACCRPASRGGRTLRPRRCVSSGCAGARTRPRPVSPIRARMRAAFAGGAARNSRRSSATVAATR
jgi:uridylate kinase